MTATLRPKPANRLLMWLPGVILIPLVLPFVALAALRLSWLAVAVCVVFLLLAVQGIVQARMMRVEYGDGRYRYLSLYRRRDFVAGDVAAVHTLLIVGVGAFFLVVLVPILVSLVSVR